MDLRIICSSMIYFIFFAFIRKLLQSSLEVYEPTEFNDYEF